MYNKEYYEEHKEKILASNIKWRQKKSNERFQCECQEFISELSKYKHIHSKKHFKNLEFAKKLNKVN